jgi:hypothetical protein
MPVIRQGGCEETATLLRSKADLLSNPGADHTYMGHAVIPAALSGIPEEMPLAEQETVD